MTLAPSDWAAFGQQFFQHYSHAGFGRQSKRDIDVLVFHLYERAADLESASDAELAKRRRTTPAGVRGLRREARYVHQ